MWEIFKLPGSSRICLLVNRGLPRKRQGMFPSFWIFVICRRLSKKKIAVGFCDNPQVVFDNSKCDSDKPKAILINSFCWVPIKRDAFERFIKGFQKATKKLTGKDGNMQFHSFAICILKGVFFSGGKKKSEFALADRRYILWIYEQTWMDEAALHIHELTLRLLLRLSGPREGSPQEVWGDPA